MKYPLIALLLVLMATACEDVNLVSGPRKLDYYIDSFNGNGDFKPQSKVTYSYDASNKLERYTFYAYDQSTNLPVEDRHFRLTYDEGRVQKVEGYNVGAASPHIVYTYTYLEEGLVTKITEHNVSTGLDGKASFAYFVDSKTVIVTYNYSNGGSFRYEYVYDDSGNILSDKTTRGSELCSSGTYTYDQAINPFASLGYVDFALLNVSANNKLSEDVNYLACGFPSFIPESHTYSYDDQGYPTEATTFYKPADPSRKSERRYFYK